MKSIESAQYKDKENFKRSDKRDTFLVVIPTENEADASLKDLRNVLHARKSSLQALIVVVGTVVKFGQIYVVINDYWYESKTFKDALDLTLKAFFALDCDYPAECCNIWYFLQLAIYDIQLPPKGVALKVKTIAKQVEDALRRHKA